LQISAKEIVHQGDVRFTPLAADGSIDAQAVAALIADEYSRLGLSAQDIRAGAIIVTGETAKLRNAKAVAEQLSQFAGNFVCVSAGPNHESVLAARGSGAWAASESQGKTICNVDIGGGTVNAAVIASGKLIDTAAMGIGARFIQLDADGEIVSMTERAKAILGDLAGATPRSAACLDELVTKVAELIMQFLTANDVSHLRPLMLTDPLRLIPYTIDEFWFSGGVGELMAALDSDATVDKSNQALYKDAGPMLASILVTKLKQAPVKYLVPPDSIRATVIGAGMHSIQLSGATIDACENVLPLTNVPLLRINLDVPYSLDSLRQSVAGQCSFRDHDWQTTCAALFIEKLPDTNFERLKELSMDLAALIHIYSARPPYIIVLKEDAAAALGMLLRKALRSPELIVVDGIDSTDGDYIDIGKPIIHSQLGTVALALPVVVKTIIFRN
jgi:ethanolamine utilization protein EutA